MLIGKRQAIVSSNDRSPAALAELIVRAIAMAKTVPEDPYCGLAAPEELARDWPSLELALEGSPPSRRPRHLIARASEAEDAALAVTGVTNSEGAEASWGRSKVSLAASNGFAGSYSGALHSSISAKVLAGTGTGMERDYDYSTAVWAEDLLEAAATIGKRAGERAVKRLESSRARCRPARKCSVMFDPRVAGGMLRHLIGAINWAWRMPRAAPVFCKDKLGQRIFPAGLAAIIDDPHRRARPARQAIRRRRRAQSAPRHRRGRRAADLAVGSALRAAARLEEHRPCQPRHLRPARPGADQSLSWKPAR